jgi:hypothetical protein
MKNEPRITPSKLGALCGPNPCYKCFWLLLLMCFKKPFDFGTPFIMQQLDKRHKQIARVALQQWGQLPDFFGPFRSAIKLINVDSFSAYHQETNLQLYGMPDIVLEHEDGTRMIIDDKTASVKTEDEALYYKYEAQLNFYGFLCEQMAEAYKVSRIGLLYYVYAPVTDDEILDTVGSSTITVGFNPILKEVDYDPKRIVLPLLKKVRELLNMNSPPESADGCKDCPRVGELSKLFHQTDDLEYIRKVMTPREWRQDQAKRRYAALTDSAPDIQERAEMLIRQATPGGVLATWDFIS